MKVYADYEFYKNAYGGGMDEELFAPLLVRASQYIRYVTMNRSEQYEGDEVKYAVCEVADVYGRFDTKLGRMIRSENTDGYSVAYAAEGTTRETAEQTRDRKALQAARKWLLPVGLLDRRIECRRERCRHDYECGPDAL